MMYTLFIVDFGLGSGAMTIKTWALIHAAQRINIHPNDFKTTKGGEGRKGD